MTIEIPLTQGQVTIVDDIDSDLTGLSWYFSGPGYAARYAGGGRKNTKTEYLHRAILERKLGRTLDKVEFADHVNRNRLDNRRQNLRPATPGQSVMNRAGKKGRRSIYKGLYYFAKRGKWIARIRKNNVVIAIGSFKDEVAAARAYDEKAREYFGEFAVVNFPDESHKN